MKLTTLQRLLEKYHKGSAEPVERHIVDRWYDSFDAQDPEIPGLEDKHTREALKKRLWTQIVYPSNPPVRWYARPAWRIAALFLLGSGVMLATYLRQSDSVPPRTEAIATISGTSSHITTGDRQIKRLLLPDSTEVYLNANSSLEIPESFGRSERSITLTGEAYFDVHRDSIRPFRIRADELDIQVLGTSFNVKAYQLLKDIKVDVYTGRVQVSQGDETQRMLLSADDQLVYLRASARMAKSSRQYGHESSWRKGIVVLDQADFEELQLAFHNIYGVWLESRDREVTHAIYNFTVRSTRTLEQSLDQLGETIRKKYRKEDGRIMIY